MCSPLFDIYPHFLFPAILFFRHVDEHMGSGNWVKGLHLLNNLRFLFFDGVLPARGMLVPRNGQGISSFNVIEFVLRLSVVINSDRFEFTLATLMSH